MEGTLAESFPGSLMPRSALPGVVWPTLPQTQHHPLFCVLAQLQITEWWPAERLRQMQLQQAAVLLDHAKRTSPWYQRSLAHIDPARLDEASWAEVPLITRAELRQTDVMLSRAIPPQHGAVNVVSTSGSTGFPVKVSRTALFGLYWSAMTVREILWHRKDTSAKLITTRFLRDLPSDGLRGRGWGPWSDVLGPPGETVTLDIRTPVSRQLELLVAEAPAYLLTYPTNLGYLVELAEREGVTIPNLRAVATLSELLRPDVREATRRVFGVPIHDMYSTQEVGYLGLQCPEHEHLHVPSEDVLVEVLDDAGRPCAPGEVGRVVVTSLHNFATPIVRYDVGDFAEVGAPCPCGRGLPVLNRVLGRVRNSILTDRGDRIWPQFGTTKISEKYPKLVQHQLAQTSFTRIEARLVVEEPLTEDERAGITAEMRKRLPEGMEVEIVEVDAIPRSASGKFEDFICLIEPKG